jgi:hypothetical protein
VQLRRAEHAAPQRRRSGNRGSTREHNPHELRLRSEML